MLVLIANIMLPINFFMHINSIYYERIENVCKNEDIVARLDKLNYGLLSERD